MTYVNQNTYLAMRRRAGVGVIPNHPCAKGHTAWYLDRKTGYVRCRECLKEQSLRWRRDNRARALALRRRARMIRAYGLSPEDKERLWHEQGRACAICACPIDLKQCPVDHDHKTGFVRGLLCNNCNMFLGRIEADVERMEACLRYLRR